MQPLWAPALGQTTSSNSEGMQALVAEIRQLRKDLQTTNGYALKTQILLYRLQVQEATVRLVGQHPKALRSQLAETQKQRWDVAAALKREEESSDHTEISPADRKQIQWEISGNKSVLET